MRRPARLPALIAVLVLAPALVPVPGLPGQVRADDVSDARALFEQARGLAKAGNHAEACPLFERSLALEPALGTELNLALCLAATGKLVAAARMFEALVDKTTGPDQARRHDIAVQGAAALAKRIPTLRLRWGEGVDGARVDGEPADAEVVIPLDPGRHVIEADGAARQVIELAEGEARELDLVARVPAAAAPGPATVAGAPSTRWPWLVGGAGAGALAASAITGLVVLRRREAGLDRCEDQAGQLVCDPAGAALLDRARTFGHVSTGLFVVGAGLVATAVVLRLRARPARPDQAQRDATARGAAARRRVTSAGLTGWLGPAGAGVAVGAAW
jgi:hypothetical protein